MLGTGRAARKKLAFCRMKAAGVLIIAGLVTAAAHQACVRASVGFATAAVSLDGAKTFGLGTWRREDGPRILGYLLQCRHGRHTCVDSRCSHLRRYPFDILPDQARIIAVVSATFKTKNPPHITRHVRRTHTHTHAHTHAHTHTRTHACAQVCSRCGARDSPNGSTGSY